ncbi:MAG: CPBP family intramembrane metalloprotease [Gemmatimonadetes bacterium]|nr:CPBP family intramembrane metalloprotease [Gemmatimonadota bacterium]
MRPLPLLVLFILGLILTGALRWATRSFESMAALSGIPTPLYVALTVFVMIRLVRSPIGWGGIGFHIPFAPLRHLALGIAGAGVAMLAGELLTPVWEALFGAGRDLSRFDESVTTLPRLLILLAFSWTFAACGEELAFRGVLMRGLGTALGGDRKVLLFAWLLQAVVFGFVHLYQGPAGVAGATVSGLVFGGVVWIASGSLWPAIFAHGLSNTFGILSIYQW